MEEPVSLVRACRDYFEKNPRGRKFEIAEFKTLTAQDQAELADWLAAEGYALTRDLGGLNKSSQREEVVA